MQLNKKLLSDLFGYFMRGLLLVAPFALTIYIISLALNFIDGLIGIKIPGLGIAILLTSITFLGYLGSTLLVRSVFDLTENLITKLPFISTIYYSLKELTSAFVGDKKKFDKPVLVIMNKEAQLHKLGFVTQKDLKTMNLPGSIAVYVPHSYNFSGDLFILPKEAVSPVDIASTEVMKFIVSGGVAGLQRPEEQDVREATL
ncbi:MAG TPA: hypothetical protein DCQ08_03345 [Amoebophilaceae bacterium]|nr:hypothetical protein [Amoebophilaceae bacterium]